MTFLEKCRDFGRSRNNFGKQVQIKYSFGTSLGGYISLIASLTIWVIALGQLMVCFLKPSTFEWLNRDQLKSGNTMSYKLTYEHGFPSFSVYTVLEENWDGKRGDIKSSYNDKGMFDIFFKVKKPETNEEVQLDAIPCNEAVEKYVEDPVTAEMIRGSFNSSIEYFVCPDAAVFLVYEKYFLDFNNPEYQEI